MVQQRPNVLPFQKGNTAYERRVLRAISSWNLLLHPKFFIFCYETELI